MVLFFMLNHGLMIHLEDFNVLILMLALDGIFAMLLFIEGSFLMSRVTSIRILRYKGLYGKLKFCRVLLLYVFNVVQVGSEIGEHFIIVSIELSIFVTYNFSS
jgi:hypothetical protein